MPFPEGAFKGVILGDVCLDRFYSLSQGTLTEGEELVQMTSLLRWLV